MASRLQRMALEIESFLKEFAVRRQETWTRERLRKASLGLSRLVRDEILFSFVKMAQNRGGERPNTNNAAESVNSKLRETLYLHRIKAVFTHRGSAARRRDLTSHTHQRRRRQPVCGSAGKMAKRRRRSLWVRHWNRLERVPDAHGIQAVNNQADTLFET